MSKVQTIWLRPKEESLEVQYADKAFTARLGFKTDTGYWTTNPKEFSNAKHLNNFANYIERTKGFQFDEVWVE